MSGLNFQKILSPKTSQKIMNSIFVISGLVTILILIIILGYILIRGLPVVNLGFIFSNPIDSGASGGIFPMIVSSLYVTLIAGIVATPLGVGAAVYLVEFAGESKITKLIRFGAETLASIPSIVYGLFGLAFFVIAVGLGWSIISGGLVLAIMALPTIFQVSEVTISSIPSSYREGSYGLGATKWQTIYRVVLPAAIPGIVTGVILGMTRAISEAAAVMFAVGASLSMPLSIFDPGRPLPLHLYILATEGISLENAFGTAAVLVIIVLALTITTNYLVDRYQRKIMGR
ncbi:MAG: phosphate ABC transporter permease PstA [Methanobrevibacter arboriphilus]|jgi:phosphate transport system permease protein|uniref:Phosphate ABC transporter, permease protein PstA n=2 Tax=Methanobrevibacter arboriphilus TaxID=39441 RepID=A0ACA8R4G8_METAZ|nr:phosphate ABC transporter permease PstA [Methanobrevibacter arboriphilus]MBF4469330.1 phosphate ABC transporter permease PstA [Methanobrevibacter arboriphilus]BBL61823.1 phosphate ABC transporter, permease protein PstA [Methanobrevibacter arboriphilus]GLI10935.1 phosphate ABC transporter, permease protein PstA [Methanobrevibacter arboriphilus]